MYNELKTMVKKVFLADVVIGIIAVIATVILFKDYTYLLVLGLILSLINFLVNTVVTSFVVTQSGNKSLNFFGSVFRIIITIIFAIILCGNDKNKYIAILMGYTLHYFAIIFYGLTENRIERK